MPTIYLRPEDISDAQAAVILDYLNSTDNAAEIAARIELENELDIGEGLALRLIRAREQLGGRFENLQQVFDVPYIGPERFTEIAVSLLDLRLPNAGLSATPAYRELLDELAQLRSEVSRLRNASDVGIASGPDVGRRVQLHVLQADVFLGQHVTLEIHAFSTEDQRPLVDQLVTLSTNWGVLQYQQGYRLQQDAVVAVRTDINGRARVRLRSPTYEALTQEQQLALEAALQTLDAAAPTPQSIREQLEALVLSYRLENNLELRKAIDIYFNAQKVAIIESVNRRFFSDSWHFHHALISAYLHLEDNEQLMGQVQGAGNGLVESITTVRVRLKDWVGAWYQTYLDYLENGNEFSERVQSLAAHSGDSGRLINGVLSEISRWTLDERGIAGSIIGEKSTESVVRKFLANDIQQLPDQQQLQLYSALSVAVKPTAATQVGTLQAVADTQLTLADEISSRIGSVEDIASLASSMQQDLETFNSRFSDFQSSMSQFNTDLASFTTNLTGFNDDLSSFNSSYAEFETSYATFDTQYVDFNSRYGTFDTQYDDFNTRYGTFGTKYDDFNTRYGTFSTQYDDFNNRYGNFDTQYDDFNTRYGTFSTQYDDFNNRYGNFGTQYDDFNTRYVTFDKQYDEFNTRYGAFDTQYDDFNTRYGTFDVQYSRFSSEYGTFNNQLSAFNTSFAGFKTNLSDFNNKYRSFDQRLMQFDSQLTSVNADLASVRSDMVNFNASYTEFNNNLGTLRTDIVDLKANVKRIDTRIINPNR